MHAANQRTAMRHLRHPRQVGALEFLAPKPRDRAGRERVVDRDRDVNRGVGAGDERVTHPAGRTIAAGVVDDGEVGDHLAVPSGREDGCLWLVSLRRIATGGPI